MTYQYTCESCGRIFDVIKSVKDIDVSETCPDCGEFAVRNFVPCRIHLSKTAVEHTEWNPGLGAFVKNSAHRKELCKIKGVEEVGSEPVEKIHSHYQKAREEKREAEWDKATEGWQGNGE